MEVHDIVQEAVIKTIPKKKKCKKAKWLSEEVLQIAVKRREVKSKGEKTAFWMGENNSKWNNWQTTNLKNIKATSAAQFQKNKRPNQKMGQRTK